MKNIIFSVIFISIITGITFNIICLEPAFSAPAKETFYKSLNETAKGTGHDRYSKLELGTMAGSIIKVFLSFLGVIFLGWTIYAGMLWMTSRGNEKDIERAKNMIINSVIGLAIIILAYAITAYVGSQIGPG